MTKKSWYKISDIVLCISYDHATLFDNLHQEIKRHVIDSTEKCSAEISVIFCEKIPRPPEGAVLTGKWLQEGREEYVFENKHFLSIENKVLISLDHANQKVQIEHSVFNKEVLTFSRIAMKWLIIKAAERLGHTYVHGSALRYQDRNLLFAGDSGSGKSSFLFRLLRAGGKILTDDALLLSNQQIIPFVLNVSMRSDFSERFGLTKVSENKIRYDLGELADSNENVYFVGVNEVVTGLDILVLPRVHHSKISHIESCTSQQAIERLSQIYEKEVSWNAFIEPLNIVKARYEKMLKNCTCIFFYAGSDEEEIKRVFFKWLEKTV